MHPACLLLALLLSARADEPAPPPHAPPVLDALTIAPATPTTADALTCTPGATSDPDGDPVTVALAWEIDGQPAGTGPTLAATATHAGMKIRCIGTPSDGEVEGAAVHSATVTVANTPPILAGATLGPADPRRGTDLHCAAGDTSDADGDSVTLRYAWSAYGKPVPGTTDTLAGSTIRRGQAITCTVTPTDGHDDGEPVTSASVTVDNSPPTAAAPLVKPAKPVTTDDLTCVPGAAHDADGDQTTLAFAWSADGTDLGVAEATLPAARTTRGQAIACTVTASDGTDASEPATSDGVTVADSPPTLAGASVSPETPHADDAVRCVPGETADPDGDAVTVAFAWSVDGQPAQGDGATLDPAHVVRGARLACTATPSDGEQTGSAVTSKPVVVADTPPVLAGVTLTPDAPRAGDTLTCAPGEATDADGDAVTLHYAWRAGDEDTGHDAPILAAPARDTPVSCTVTPTDGTAKGEPVPAGPVIVQNTPPTIASAHVDPAAPDVTSTVTCEAEGVQDADGDEVALDIAWTVAGKPAGEGSALASGTFAKHQTVGCTATPTDGAAQGEPVTADPVQVRDAPPVVDAITVLPNEPDTEAILAATVKTSDPDGDPVTVTWSWEVNGQPAKGVGQRLDGRTAFHHGDRVRAGLTANDGEVDGALTWSAPVTIVDTPPTQPSVGIEDPARNGGALVCRVLEPSTDLDGDPITYRFAWTRNGKAYTRLGRTALSGDTVPASSVRLDQAWSCTATPTDGQRDGTPSKADRLVIIAPTVGTGSSHSCALPADGHVVCWGNRDYGLTMPPEDRLSALSVGGWHNCGIRQRDDRLVCWGHDGYGQSEPPEGRYRQVAAGGWHTCALDDQGAITCWGQAADDRLKAPAGTFVAMSAGWKHTCAIDDQGALTCWGANDAGQCDAPAGTWKQVSAGQTHTCALDTAGHVRCWGQDELGSLDAPSGTFVQVVTGSRFSCALRADGTVACWGFDAYGQLKPPDARFRYLGRGVDALCGWTTDGHVACWGRDQQGESDPPVDVR